MVLAYTTASLQPETLDTNRSGLTAAAAPTSPSLGQLCCPPAICHFPQPLRPPTLPPCPPARARPHLAFTRRFVVPTKAQPAPAKAGRPRPSYHPIPRRAQVPKLKRLAAGRVGPTNVAMPTQVSPWRQCCRLCPLWVQGSPCPPAQRTTTARCGPTSTAQSPAVALPPQGVGAEPAPAKAGGLPCALFPFVGFGPSFTEALGLRSARALADTTCPPLSTFPTPPSGAVRPPTGQCLAATVRLPLSTCPGPLKPKLHRVPPGTGRPEKTRRTIQSNSNRRSTRASERECYRASTRGRGRRPAKAEGAPPITQKTSEGGRLGPTLATLPLWGRWG